MSKGRKQVQTPDDKERTLRQREKGLSGEGSLKVRTSKELSSEDLTELPKRKVGRFHRAEEDYIRRNAGKMSSEAIAEKLNRSVGVIKSWIATHLALGLDDDENGTPGAIMERFRATMMSKQLRDEFFTEEIKYFEERYLQLMTQFKEELTPTEEEQICQSIKCEILMHRALRDKQHYYEVYQKCRKKISNLIADGGQADERKEEIITLGIEIEKARAEGKTLQREHKDLQNMHQGLMRELKATREQRISKIESSKQSFVGLLKALQEDDFRESEGRQAELMRKAIEKERARLAQPIKYADGMMDRPILSVDTVNVSGEGEQGVSTEEEVVSPSSPIPCSSNGEKKE